MARCASAAALSSSDMPASAAASAAARRRRGSRARGSGRRSPRSGTGRWGGGGRGPSQSAGSHLVHCTQVPRARRWSRPFLSRAERCRFCNVTARALTQWCASASPRQALRAPLVQGGVRGQGQEGRARVQGGQGGFGAGGHAARRFHRRRRRVDGRFRLGTRVRSRGKA